MMLSSRVLCRAAIIGTLVATSLPAAAYAQATTTRTNETIPVEDHLLSCSGEVVRVEGTDHVMFHGTWDAAGGLHVMWRDNYQGVGGESEAGTLYRVVSTRQDDHANGRPPDGAHQETEPERTYLLVSQGSTDNTRVHVLIHDTLNANGEQTADATKLDSGCVG
jgi:hypothetical protein